MGAFNMHIRGVIVASSLALSSLSAFGQAENPYDTKSEFHQFALSGKKSHLANYASVQVGCSLSDWTDISIAKPPLHGEAILIDARVAIYFAKENPRSGCNGRSVPGRALEYTPAQDYKGADEIVVETINSDGMHFTYHITVQ
jgi:hypothetical protein